MLIRSLVKSTSSKKNVVISSSRMFLSEACTKSDRHDFYYITLSTEDEHVPGNMCKCFHVIGPTYEYDSLKMQALTKIAGE